MSEQHAEFLSLKKRLHRYTYQNTTLMEITCHGSVVLIFWMLSQNLGVRDEKAIRAACAVQEFSSGGVQVNLTKKALTRFFFFF